MSATVWEHTGATVDVHSSAIVPPTTLLWAFARILADVVIDTGVSIGGGTEIGRGSKIGAWSRVGANVFLPPNSHVGRYVFIGPGVVCTDDRHPRVPVIGDPPYNAEPPIIEDEAAIGAGAVILPGVRIGMGARVAAGAIVTKDVPVGGFVRGEPAREHILSDESAGWHRAERVPPSS